MENPQIYSRNNPFLAKIKERTKLTKNGSKKNTYHIVLDISGSDIHYEVGDSVAIYPSNDKELVNWTLEAMKKTGTELVFDKQREFQIPLREFLEKKANITEVTKKFLSEIHDRQTNLDKKAKLEPLFEPENKDLLKEYLATRELWDTLKSHEEVTFESQELVDLLMPLLPRFYSISSSKKAVGHEIHLTVAMIEYESSQLLRRGVCTHYLCHLAPLNEALIPIYIHPHHGFTLPEDLDTSIIMVGPGTGVAPFRAFMQERIHLDAKGKNWLIFGEKHQHSDFFYEDYWNELISKNKLQLHTAFSRDQDEKVYVQHRILENGQEIFDWIQNGARFYICGDAKNMARDVEATLLKIIQEHGKKDEVEAKNYLKELKNENRYLKDVY